MNSYFLLWNHRHSTEVQQLRVRAVVLVDHHTFVPAVVVAGVRRAILPDCRPRLQRGGAERSFCWRAAAQQLTDRERRCSRASSCNTAQLAQFVRLPLLPPPQNSHRRRRCRSLVCSTALAWATTTIPTVANSPLPWRLPRRQEDIPDFNRPRPLATMWPLRMNPRSRQVLAMTIGLMMCSRLWTKRRPKVSMGQQAPTVLSLIAIVKLEVALWTQLGPQLRLLKPRF